MKKLLSVAGLAATVLLALTACSSPSASLVGTWGDTATKTEPSLVFTGSESSGDYSGTDGCNVVGGSYTVEGGSINLGLMRSTMMYCEDVDTWLSQARTAKIEDGELAVFDETGAQIGTLGQSSDE